MALGPANTRVRDYADICTLTGSHLVAHDTVRVALLATAAFRGTELVLGSSLPDESPRP